MIDIKKFLEEADYKSIKEFFVKLFPQDIAEILQTLDKRELVIAFRLVPYEKSVDVFSNLDACYQEEILSNFADAEVKDLITRLDPDDRTSLFEELPGILTQKLLNFLPQNQRKEALKLLGYPEDSVGRLMTPDYVALHPEWTIKKAFIHIKKFGRDAETINMIYIVDENWKLIDDIPIRRFVLADTEKTVREIMDYHFVCIEATEDQEQAYNLMKKYDLTVLPVVDKQDVLLGIVTIDDILEVIEEETNEDFQKLSAISPTEDNYSVLSSLDLYKKRIGWLFILLITDFLSSSIIAHFENEIQAVIALAFFIPVLIDSGGNISAQSSTLVIRALATGDLGINKWLKVLKKELLIGLLIGISLGIILYLRGFIWRGGPTIGLVVALSMVGISIWANLLGGLLPIILTKLRLDPAVISSPLLTTLIDSTGLLIYFTIAKLIFHL